MPTVISLEQALALPYATQRFVQLGWRVIRIESPPEKGGGYPGDPNRYIGADLGYPDLHSYYIAPNIGKEAITLNLKKKEGQNLLLRIIKELKVDIFMCATLPKRYKQLGIDCETLRKTNPDLIWCGISAMGPDYPDRAGYDPALQALLGFTYLTGDPDGKPVPCGIPVIDLKAGDEAFTQVLLAMLGHTPSPSGRAGEGLRAIHISMAQCAASWLITALPQLEFVKNNDELFKRSGNEHRSFIPCNIYPTKDGMVYLAIGNDLQWAKFTAKKEFEHLAIPEWKTNAGRMKEKEKIYKGIGAVLKKFTTDEFVTLCLSLNLSVASVNSIKDVAALPFVKNFMMKTKLPSGKKVNLFPPSHTTHHLVKNNFSLNCAPRLGEHNEQVMTEAGLNRDEIDRLNKNGII